MVAAKKSDYTPERAEIATSLLAWYDKHHRDLPWRVPPGAATKGRLPDPFHVWLSEIMLQQTTVEAVKPYFRSFLKKWPDVGSLAAASEDDVLKAWAGLGYYSRARNLKKCADILAANHGGQFPDTEDGLRRLPGIGDYTAAAIAAIAFGRPAAVVDGNVERVVTRLCAIATPLPDAKPQIREFVRLHMSADLPGDFAQAMMDLGATICTPRRPSCMVCPVREACTALATNDPELYPVKRAKADKPQRYGAAFVVLRDGAILLRKRPPNGLLGGMSEVPTTGWTARVDGDTTTDSAPFPAQWRKAGSITHVFTHFALELLVYTTEAGKWLAPEGYRWARLADIHEEALPTVMKKAIEAAVPGATKLQGRHGGPNG